MSDTDFPTLVDPDGRVTAVVVPIDVWREIASERETQHLLASPAMRERLLRGLAADDALPMDDVVARLGLTDDET